LAHATSLLTHAADPSTARLDAELLMGHVTGFSRARLFAFPETELCTEHGDALELLLGKRLSGTPLAYLTNQREFWSLPLVVTPDVLIPRPDTEVLVEKVLELEPDAPAGCIIELGTGSGAIALALAQELPQRTIIAVEKHSAALAIAHLNVRRFGLGRVQLVQGNWLDAVAPGSAAMIIANPPYLAADDEHLPHLACEPQSALVSGATGLEDLEHIIEATGGSGVNQCVLLLEHGYQQAAAVQSLMSNYNYSGISTEQDLAGLDRITYATINNGAQ